MSYWICLLSLFIILIFFLYFIWKKKIKDSDMEKGDFIIPVTFICISLFFLIMLCLDIPSALSGGESVYVNDLPIHCSYGKYFSFVKTDNKKLMYLKFGDWNKYDKNGNYRIRYTKFNKIVLDIEKLD